MKTICMTNQTPFRQMRSATVLGVLAISLLSACATRAKFNVVRPPDIATSRIENGTRIMVLPVRTQGGGGGAYAAANFLTQELRSAVVSSPGKGVVLTEQSPGLVVRAQITDWQLVRERKDNADKCTVYRNGRKLEFQCTYVRIESIGTLRTYVEVLDASGQVLHAKEYKSDATESVTGVISSESSVNDPPTPAPEEDLVRSAANSQLFQIASTFVPLSMEVEEEFSSCHGDMRCDRAIALVQRGELVEASALLDEVGQDVESNPAASAFRDPADQAHFFRNRAIVRRYSGDKAGALADMTLAVRLNPQDEDWLNELKEIRNEAANAGN